MMQKVQNPKESEKQNGRQPLQKQAPSQQIQGENWQQLLGNRAVRQFAIKQKTLLGYDRGQNGTIVKQEADTVLQHPRSRVTKGGSTKYPHQEATSTIETSMTQTARSTQMAVQQQTSQTVQRGLFGSLWKGIKKGANSIWKGIKTGAKTVWKGIKTSAKYVWNGIKWVGKQVWNKLSGSFLRLYRWFNELPTRLFRLFSLLWQGVKAFKPWALSWWKSLAKLNTWSSLGAWLLNNVVALLELTGLGEWYETIADLIKFNTRPMTSTEINLARQVFGNSINYHLVRIDERALIGPAISNRPYTSLHTINSWGQMSNDTLVHELVHVWQYETSGAIYMAQALHAQLVGEGYIYGKTAGVNQENAEALKAKKEKGVQFANFNREQQAQIVQDFFIIKHYQRDLAPYLPIYAYFVKAVSTHSISTLGSE